MDTLEGMDQLVAGWTLVGDELALVESRRSDPARLAFALMLRFYGENGRLPTGPEELSIEVIDFVARQVGAAASDVQGYSWSGRTFELHRAEVRRHFGFRESTVDDADRGLDWLTEHVCQRERSAAVVRDELLSWFRRERVELPKPARVERVIRLALHQGELAVTSLVASRLPFAVRGRLDDLVAHPDDAEPIDEDDESAWSLMLAAPGEISLNTMLVEIDKLNAVRFVGVPGGVLDDVAPAVVERWRTRAAVESPSHLRTHPDDLRWSLLGHDGDHARTGDR